MSTSKSNHPALLRIVVVGGGAGGLELATSLGKTLGKKRQAEITLVDCSQTHIWKPLLHEVAAGTMDSHDDEWAYLAQARANHFHFVLGRMDGLDRENKQVKLAAIVNHQGEEIVQTRRQGYDILAIAIGSLCNDFGIPGVAEHCQFLDTTEQAELFQQRLLEAYLRVQAKGGTKGEGELDIAIVGGGATGIELSAQLHQATALLNAYGLDKIKPSDIKLHLVEASDKLLPQLPPRLSEVTAQQLRTIGVNLRLGEKVVEVTKEGMKTQSGLYIQAATKVWAAWHQSPRLPARHRRAGDQSHQPTGGAADIANHTRRRHLRPRRLRRLPLAGKRPASHDPAPRPIRPPNGQPSPQEYPPSAQRPAAERLRLHRLRLPGLPGQIQHGRESDGEFDGHGDDRRCHRPAGLPVPVQDAPNGLVRPVPRRPAGDFQLLPQPLAAEDSSCIENALAWLQGGAL